MIKKNDTQETLPVVLVLCQGFVFYSEVFIYRQIANLARVQPVVAAMARQNADQFPFDEVHSLRSTLLPVRIVNSVLKRMRILEWDEGVESCQRLRKLIDRIQPSLILAQSGWVAARFIGAIETCQVPLVVSFFGSDITAIGRQAWYARDFARVVHSATTSIFPSRFLLEKAHEAGWRFHLEHVIPHGVAVPEACSPPLRLDNGVLRIVCVGRFSEEKGHSVLVAACEILFRRGIRFHVDLVGAGRLLGDILKAVEKAELNSAFHFHGSQPSDKVHELIRAADVLVLPSIRCATGVEESFGVALVEAASQGRACVASRVGGIPEIVVDGVTGILVAERSHESLADALEGLARNPDTIRTMGRRAWEHARRNFQVNRMASSLDDALLGSLR